MKLSFKYWAIVGMVCLVLGFELAESLVLDADEADLRYQRLVVDADRFNQPEPGNAYIFNHSIGDFRPTMVCALQTVEEELRPTPATFSASNVWGSGLNSAVEVVGGYLGEKIIGFVTVAQPRAEWVYSKTHLPKINVPFDMDCLEKVMETAAKPNFTVFIVDTVYWRSDQDDDQPAVVRLDDPILLESCSGNCPKPISIRNVVRADRFARFKGDYRIVHIE